VTEHESDKLGAEELEQVEGEPLPDREVMSVVSPVPDGDLVFIEPDTAEPSDQHPLPGPQPDKGPPPLDW
jgi:hypothetical protein